MSVTDLIPTDQPNPDDPFAGLPPDEVGRAKKTVALVREWLDDAAKIAPHRSAELLAEVLRDPEGLAFTVGFVDEVIRPEDTRVAAHSLNKLSQHAPRFLPWWMRAAVRTGGAVAPVLPDVVVPIARRVMRQMVGHLIIDATPKKLGKGIARLRRQGVKLNVNLLGEAVLGRGEASRRLSGTKELLSRDDVDYASIKVSSTVAPHSPWAFDAAVDDIVEQLTPLFRIANEASPKKFVNLDMEEYRDLDLTVAVFTQLLDQPEFLNLSAGIVLQAYLPDALAAMIHLQEWSAQRRARGGADIKVRVVKGANLPMEKVEAKLHGWPLATWHTKQESDTNYKRVLDYALTPQRIANVRIGIAGHNLFDVADSWVLAAERGIDKGVEYEMLLGMAEGQAAAVRKTVGGLRLYTPVVSPKQFDVAIAYLIRRLEEGASSDNFMSAVFDLADNEELFVRERDRFLASLRALDDEVPRPHRVADRYAAIGRPEPGDFKNTPDTDPAVKESRAWATHIIETAANSTAGEETISAAQVTDSTQLDEVLADADQGGRAWGDRSSHDRAKVLRAAGAALEANRARLIEVAMSETGKTLEQADPEASEAIDFAYYYADQAEQLDHIDGARFSPVPLTLVTPPWNFPIAIPAGSTLSALAAGSGVVLKPAPAARRCGAVLAEVLWEAGIPRDALTLIDAGERELGKQLISDPRIHRVILTGAYETAQLFRSFRPDLPLLAETSGKNAIIVTPSADLDLAVKDVVHSAFGHAGQKCSAASLVILVGSVARSQRFRNQLIDAVSSLAVGTCFDPGTQVSRVVEQPGEKLLRGLTQLGPGESWLVEPKQLGEDSRLWSPGIREGVQRGSEYHLTEYFGPILGIMTAAGVGEAIEMVNDIDYGLTSGIHSLDEDEVRTWLDRIQAGNLYINRGITGAIVRRQPFGGWKKSSVGAGAKAGGPNYLIGLGTWQSARAVSANAPVDQAAQRLIASCSQVLDEADSEWLHRCASSDAQAWRDVFSRNEDVSNLEVERNVLRYRPVANPVVIRFESDSVPELLRVVVAALAARAKPVVSAATPVPSIVERALAEAGIKLAAEDREQWRQRLMDPHTDRVRYLGTAPGEVTVAAGGRPDLAVWGGEVTEAGRIELLPFLREQAVSITAHRFGTPSPLAHDVL